MSVPANETEGATCGLIDKDAARSVKYELNRRELELDN